MDVRTVKSRLLGDMTFETGGPVLAVHDVKLRADPVDFDLLRTLNGKPFPADWQGKITGDGDARAAVRSRTSSSTTPTSSSATRTCRARSRT